MKVANVVLLSLCGLLSVQAAPLDLGLSSLLGDLLDGGLLDGDLLGQKSDQGLAVKAGAGVGAKVTVGKNTTVKGDVKAKADIAGTTATVDAGVDAEIMGLDLLQPNKRDLAADLGLGLNVVADAEVASLKADASVDSQVDANVDTGHQVLAGNLLDQLLEPILGGA